MRTSGHLKDSAYFGNLNQTSFGSYCRRKMFPTLPEFTVDSIIKSFKICIQVNDFKFNSHTQVEFEFQLT